MVLRPGGDKPWLRKDPLKLELIDTIMSRKPHQPTLFTRSPNKDQSGSIHAGNTATESEPGGLVSVMPKEYWTNLSLANKRWIAGSEATKEFKVPHQDLLLLKSHGWSLSRPELH